MTLLAHLTPDKVKGLPPDKVAQLYKSLQPKLTKFIPQAPTPKQALFLLQTAKEVLFGGAAGGGKSSAMLMAALQYVDVPGYAALVLRRTYADLAKENAIMDRAQQWLAPFVGSGEVHWNGTDKVFTFPSGATLSFGHMQHEKSKYNYQGAEYQFIGFDELTHFTETMHGYMLSRLRRLQGFPVPLRIWGATNPGNIGHEWVKLRFIIEGKSKGRIFIPAQIADNPYLNQEEYIANLMELDPTTREQLLRGDWDATIQGNLFKRHWFKLIQRGDLPKLSSLKLVRYWDLAATEPSPDNRDPDWTAGVLTGYDSSTNYKYILDVVRTRSTPHQVKKLVRATAEKDGKAVMIRMEQEPGAGGVNVIAEYRAHVLPDFNFKGVKPQGDKVARAIPVANAAEAGDYHILEAPWTNDLLLELLQFNSGGEVHDDQVDGVTGGYDALVPLQRKPTPHVTKNIYGERPR